MDSLTQMCIHIVIWPWKLSLYLQMELESALQMNNLDQVHSLVPEYKEELHILIWQRVTKQINMVEGNPLRFAARYILFKKGSDHSHLQERAFLFQGCFHWVEHTQYWEHWQVSWTDASRTKLKKNMWALYKGYQWKQHVEARNINSQNKACCLRKAWYEKKWIAIIT